MKFKVKLKLLAKLLAKLLLLIVIIVFIFIITLILIREYRIISRDAVLQKIRIQDSLDCECEYNKVRISIQRGNLIAHYHGEPFLKDILMKRYNISAEYMKDDYSRMMDSAIFSKYGEDFYDRILKEIDSLYVLRNKYYLDIDGNYLQTEFDPIYKCGGYNELRKYILYQLLLKRIIPLKQPLCYPDRMTVDAIITKDGKLENPRILQKINPLIDSAVLNLFQELPCGWIPAKDGGVFVNYKIEFYFSFSNKSIKSEFIPLYNFD